MNISNIDLNLLVSLEALLSERNVTRAAARLGLSQPALSSQLTRLRDIFKDPLLVPAQRGMIPTARALELIVPLRAALEGLLGVVKEQATFEPQSAKQTLSLMASDYIQAVKLVPFTSILEKEAPHMRVSWRPYDAHDLVRKFETGEVEMALMQQQMAPDQLMRKKAFDERYVAIARKGHPAVGRKLTLDTFCKLRHVIVAPREFSFETPTDAALKAMGRERRVTQVVASFLIVPEIVANSDTIALIPERLVRERGDDRLRIFEPPLKVPGFSISLIWHPRDNQNTAHKWLREKILK